MEQHRDPLTYAVDVPDFWTRIAPYLNAASYEAVRLVCTVTYNAPIVESVFERLVGGMGSSRLSARETVRRLVDRSICFRCGGGEGASPSMLMLCHCVTLRDQPPFFVRFHAACVRGAESSIGRDRAAYGAARNVTVVRCPMCAVDRIALLVPRK